MAGNLSIDGEQQDWVVFSRTIAGRQPILFRSRTSNPELRAFAEANVMTRLRCVLPPEQQNDAGMPKSTEELDRFEDDLIRGLTERNAQTYLLAVVTGEGNRDLFFTSPDGSEIRSVVKDVPYDPSFRLEIGNVQAKEQFLDKLTVPPEALERAKAEAAKGGGFFSKIFGGGR